MSVLPSAQPRHVVHAASGAWTIASGAPTAFKFAYGTWSVPDVGASWGIITSYTAAAIGDKSNLKDEAGSTFGIPILDPGWQISLSILHDVSTKAPARGTVIGALLPSAEKIFNPGSGTPDLYAVVLDVSIKWEREGWRMIEVGAEFRESLNLGDVFSASIKENGGVATVIHSPA